MGEGGGGGGTSRGTMLAQEGWAAPFAGGHLVDAVQAPRHPPHVRIRAFQPDIAHLGICACGTESR